MQPQDPNAGQDLQSLIFAIGSEADVKGLWANQLKSYYFATKDYDVRPDSTTEDAVSQADLIVVDRLTSQGARPTFVLETKYIASDGNFYEEALWDRYMLQLYEYLGKVPNPLQNIVDCAIAINAYVRFYSYESSSKEMMGWAPLPQPGTTARIYTLQLDANKEDIDFFLQGVRRDADGRL